MIKKGESTMKKKVFIFVGLIVIIGFVVIFFNQQSDKKIYVETKKLGKKVVLIVENDFEKPLNIIQKNNDDMLIEALSPKESSVLIYSDKDFDDSIYDQITSIENDKCKLYGDYEEDIVIDISKQNIDASFSKKTDDLKKCYGEAVVFFYKDGNLVDVKKEELLFESSIISTSFKTEEEFDQAKVTHRFWTLEN